jgi:hypothetical protein
VTGPARLGSWGLVSVAVAAAAPLLAACGGGAALAKAPAAVCQQIGGVLSDGPDPGADPVGYALSEIKPLGQIHTSDASVADSLRKLIAADTALVASQGNDHAAKAAIAKATGALNTACPGVAS